MQRVVIVCDEAMLGCFELALEDASVVLTHVDDIVNAPVEIDRVDPDLVAVDGVLAGRDPEAALAMVFAACPRALKVLVVPSSIGRWINIADRSGADAIVTQPLERSGFARLLHDAAERAVPAAASSVALPRCVDRSERMRDIWRLVAVAARSEGSVVVSGETGVGKEAIARALHRFSARRHGPFVAVNCAAIPETLLESELFGHEKGAFTGATGQRKGRFELADGGTLMLDEVGELPLSTQVKLLRVLQERCFERVGGTRTISVNVRIVSATHRDLEDEVRRGRFRADLFYRIRVLSIRVPPLRLRKDDVLPLWDHFIATSAAREGRRAPTTSMAARRRLLQHRWPGNVRELQNAAEHAVMFVGSREIMPADLPELTTDRSHTEDGFPLVGSTLSEIERAAIIETYTALGSVKGAAEALGISERKVHYRLKQYRECGPAPTRLRLSALRSGTCNQATDSGHDAPRILLAEDDDDLRWSLHDFLECAGYEVVAVRDGRALLEQLGASMLLDRDRAPPDAIVSDLRMPFLTGLQLLQRVRESGWRTPVVLVSAFGDDDVRRRAASLGAAAFLDKPIDTQSLLRVLKSVVVH